MVEKADKTKLLILVAGAKGAIGTTLAAAVSTIKFDPEKIFRSLTTESEALRPFMARDFGMAGWDKSEKTLTQALAKHGVLPESAWQTLSNELESILIEKSPREDLPVQKQVEKIMRDIKAFRGHDPNAMPVLVNLLPACAQTNLDAVNSLEQLYALKPEQVSPDLVYVLGAVLSGVPVVNFTPNMVEVPVVIQAAFKQKTPISGRDGKTGQTYLKMVLASALKARKLQVNGWYSLNILGNADGRNLMNPENAAGKLVNKTDLLDEILGYSVGAQYDGPSHKVHIDYYPPRGDAKEAWDVIDFEGFMGMTMTLRMNLQGRDSILAAPLVLDLCRWMAALKQIGRRGLVPELAFYYKKAVGANHLFTFQDQILALENLEKEICGTNLK
ncbi:MAG: hypothetical protein FP816_09205 [Desulfobacteraceae bacterium]|nr:hypothetical protein [Desulfobacteraceae bacterium]